MKLSEINSLKKKAKNLRIKTFIEFIKKGEAHLGGSFSMIEILLTLYEKVLKKMINLFLASLTLPFLFAYF